ncbi:MAG: hypothetical protein ACQEVT_01550 [Pseudomonadota bacterium]
MIQRLVSLVSLIVLAGCGEPVTSDSGSRILLLGDSLMAFNRVQGRAVSDAIENSLNEPVTDRSVIGARFLYALPI